MESVRFTPLCDLSASQRRSAATLLTAANAGTSAELVKPGEFESTVALFRMRRFPHPERVRPLGFVAHRAGRIVGAVEARLVPGVTQQLLDLGLSPDDATSNLQVTQFAGSRGELRDATRTELMIRLMRAADERSFRSLSGFDDGALAAESSFWAGMAFKTQHSNQVRMLNVPIADMTLLLTMGPGDGLAYWRTLESAA